MKPRLRSFLFLLVTLVIGMLLGAQIQSHLHDSRMKRFHIMRNETSFVQGIENAIGPLGAEQAEAVHRVVAASATRIIGSFRQGRENVRREIESMKAQLAELLDAEQAARLAARLAPPPKPHREKKDEPEKAGD